MKLKTLLLSFLILTATTAARAKVPAEFNVATYNLRQLNGGDNEAGNGWERRYPVIATLVQFHDFDIFGTQEGYKSQLEQLRAAMPGYDYIGIGRDDGKEGGEHSAIFYRTDLFEVVDHGGAINIMFREHTRTILKGIARLIRTMRNGLPQTITE